MHLRFIGHAAFVLETAGIGLLCDPWFSERVFHDGWSLYSPVTVTLDDMPEVDHLWISHEHPDHFHLPTLRAFSAERRSSLKLLFQETVDRRVIDFCSKLGFGEVVELSPEWISLNSRTEILCLPHSEGNSWAAVRSGGITILNLNDCGIRHPEELEQVRELVGDLDLLLTQFSYAHWVGNPDQPELRRSAALEKLEMVALQCQVLRPKQVIPFASQMYFSHPENFFLNDEANLPSAAVDYLSEHTDCEPVVLYNGEAFDVGRGHDTTAACEQYAIDRSEVLAKGPVGGPSTRSVSMEDLVDQASGFAARLAKDSLWYLRRLIRPAHIFLWDHEVSVMMTTDGIVTSRVPEGQCDVSLHSESLLLCLQQRWGLDTLGVSGRMHKPPGGNYQRFYRLFRPGMIAMRGNRVGFAYVFRSLVNQVLVRFGRRSN